MNTSTASLAALITFLLILTTVVRGQDNLGKNVTSVHELLNGFKETPDPSTHVSFQPLLTDSTLNFSFGFLRVDHSNLALAILHVPSSQTLWIFHPSSTTPTPWSKSIQLTFNGSLVLSDNLRVIWSSFTNGFNVVLSNTSNLQIQTRRNDQSTLWQSFDFPSDTLVETQNMTSNMTLKSPNGAYALKLGSNFFGLYSTGSGQGSDPDQIYWKNKAMEIKAKIVNGSGPIRIQINSDGYIGTYQTTSTPVDILPFNSFHRSVDSLLILKLESDGNLRGYSWNGMSWEINYVAIQSQCDLPSPCGHLGICVPGKGCTCIDERVVYSESEQCSTKRKSVVTDLAAMCGGDHGAVRPFSVLRRNGVEVAFKEYMEFKTMPSLRECEETCEKKCTCLGAMYSNSSGICYILDSVIQGLVSTGDESRVGYFKVWEGERRHEVNVGIMVVVGVGIGAVTVILVLSGFMAYRVWRRRREEGLVVEEDGEVGTGLYKHLDSFRSIELSVSSRRMDI